MSGNSGLKITKYSFREKGLVPYSHGHSAIASSSGDEDLELEFSSGQKLFLPKVRNRRNTEECDLIVVERENSSSILYCGGVLAHVVESNSQIVTTIETGYGTNDAPALEWRQDFNSFEVLEVRDYLLMYWDYGVVVLDRELNFLSKTLKYGDDVFEELTANKITFRSASTDELLVVYLDKTSS